MGRNARFAQIWKSRKGEKNDADDSLREICHLYDAIQVDPDDEKHPAEPRQVLISDNLSGYLECGVVLLLVSLQIFPAGLPLTKRVLFYATFFRLYGSTCHQLQRKLRWI
jgi:hypothetical protein